MEVKTEPGPSYCEVMAEDAVAFNNIPRVGHKTVTPRDRFKVVLPDGEVRKLSDWTAQSKETASVCDDVRQSGAAAGKSLFISSCGPKVVAKCSQDVGAKKWSWQARDIATTSSSSAVPLATSCDGASSAELPLPSAKQQEMKTVTPQSSGTDHQRNKLTIALPDCPLRVLPKPVTGITPGKIRQVLGRVRYSAGSHRAMKPSGANAKRQKVNVSDPVPSDAHPQSSNTNTGSATSKNGFMVALPNGQLIKLSDYPNGSTSSGVQQSGQRTTIVSPNAKHQEAKGIVCSVIPDDVTGLIEVSGTSKELFVPIFSHTLKGMQLDWRKMYNTNAEANREVSDKDLPAEDDNVVSIQLPEFVEAKRNLSITDITNCCCYPPNDRMAPVLQKLAAGQYLSIKELAAVVAYATFLKRRKLVTDDSGEPATETPESQPKWNEGLDAEWGPELQPEPQLEPEPDSLEEIPNSSSRIPKKPKRSHPKKDGAAPAKAPSEQGDMCEVCGGLFKCIKLHRRRCRGCFVKWHKTHSFLEDAEPSIEEVQERKCPRCEKVLTSDRDFEIHVAVAHKYFWVFRFENMSEFKQWFQDEGLEMTMTSLSTFRSGDTSYSSFQCAFNKGKRDKPKQKCPCRLFVTETPQGVRINYSVVHNHSEHFVRTSLPAKYRRQILEWLKKGMDVYEVLKIARETFPKTITCMLTSRKIQSLRKDHKRRIRLNASRRRPEVNSDEVLESAVLPQPHLQDGLGNAIAEEGFSLESAF